jgi:hypothetical protein
MWPPYVTKEHSPDDDRQRDVTPAPRRRKPARKPESPKPKPAPEKKDTRPTAWDKILNPVLQANRG